MRILVIARRFPPDVTTGRARALARLVAHLRPRHELRLVAGWHTERTRIPEDALGVDLRTRSPLQAHVALFRAVHHAARRFHPDVVLAGSIDVPLLRAPTIALVRDLAGTGWGEDAPPRDLWHRFRIRQFARVVVPGHATERALKRTGLRGAAIATIPDPIDGAGEPRPARRPGPVRIVHPGRILPAKGQHLGIDAVSRLPADRKGAVELHVVGHAVDRVYYDQLKVAARGQPVQFHPDVDDLAPWYRDADLVLYPTQLREEWPDTALEAMAFGAPVAWTDHPSVREATGGLGVALPPDDFPALRAAVLRAIDQPAELAQEGEAGRRFVEANYRWGRLEAPWEALLEAVAR